MIHTVKRHNNLASARANLPETHSDGLVDSLVVGSPADLRRGVWAWKICSPLCSGVDPLEGVVRPAEGTTSKRPSPSPLWRVQKGPQKH